MDWLQSWTWLQQIPIELQVLLVSSLPMLEARVGIPFGIALGVPPWESIALGLIGNLAQVPLVLLLVWFLQSQAAKRSARVRDYMERVQARAGRHSGLVHRYGVAGLALFVILPLPGTGIWSGSIFAYVFGMNFLSTLVGLASGILISAIAVGLASMGVFEVVTRWIH